MAFLYGFLVSIYTFICLLMVLLILIQKGKSSMGLGQMGGATQMLFGGSGGHDIFQKITWVFGAIFMIGALGLSIMRVHISKQSRYLPTKSVISQEQEPITLPPTMPDIS